MTAETAAISVTRTECVVRYTLPTSTRAPLTTASRPAVFGPLFGGRGVLGGTAGTGAELPIITVNPNGLSEGSASGCQLPRGRRGRSPGPGACGRCAARPSRAALV